MPSYTYEVQDEQQTRDLGRALAAHLRPGDLVMLSGELGAGKTTFTQGIGAGLKVAGQVTSPTFIVAREHHATPGYPALIHADAYRIKSLTDLATLDLDTALEDAVVVVEWGKGLVEDLAADRLEIEIRRATGGTAKVVDGAIDLAALDDGGRSIEINTFGNRFAGIDLAHLR